MLTILYLEANAGELISEMQVFRYVKGICSKA